MKLIVFSLLIFSASPLCAADKQQEDISAGWENNFADGILQGAVGSTSQLVSPSILRPATPPLSSTRSPVSPLALRSNIAAMLVTPAILVATPSPEATSSLIAPSPTYRRSFTTGAGSPVSPLARPLLLTLQQPSINTPDASFTRCDQLKICCGILCLALNPRKKIIVPH